MEIKNPNLMLPAHLSLISPFQMLKKNRIKSVPWVVVLVSKIHKLWTDKNDYYH